MAKKKLTKKPAKRSNNSPSSKQKPKQDDDEEFKKVKPFVTHHVLNLDSDKCIDGNYKVDCPFCGASAFAIQKKEGLFKCWDCSVSGNAYTFLQMFYDQKHSETKITQYKALSKLRKLPVDVWQMAELAYDKATRRWLIPVRNAEGSMTNLRHWRDNIPPPDKAFNMNTGGCASSLYNLERIGKATTIIICEGEWDGMAMEWLLTQAKIKDTAVVAVPGADSFKEEWCKHFADKIVYLMYDNDDRGKAGLTKAADMLRQHTRCREILGIKWPTSYRDKYDVSDHIVRLKAKYKQCFADLKKMCEELKLHDRKSMGVVRETFEEVCKDFRKHIHVSKDAEDAMLIVFSVLLSNDIFPDPYCPLWVFLVGPPGSGKTMYLQSVGDTDFVKFLSTMTPKTLISGFKDHDGSDLSVLPQIIGKTLIVKDWTSIMSLSSGEQDEIYGVMRDAYDGRVEKSFGHIKGTRVYPEPGSGHETCHFTFLAGVTGAVHADRRANHGERFLKFQLMSPSGRDAIKQIKSAIKNTVESTSPETSLRESASSFIEFKKYQKLALAKVPEWVEDRVAGLGQIVSTVRAVVMRKQGELIVRPESEVASRISKQLIKLAQAVAFTLGKTTIDEEVYRVIQRVGLDTCYGWWRDILMTVAKAGDKGMLRDEICKDAIVASTTTHRCLEDLFELGAVVYHDDKDNDGRRPGKAGQPPKRWYLSEFMKELFELAKIDKVATGTVSAEIAERRHSSPRKLIAEVKAAKKKKVVSKPTKKVAPKKKTVKKKAVAGKSK